MSNNFFSQNRVADPELAEDGVWVTGVYNGQLDIKVRRTKSQKATEVRRRVYKPFQNQRKIADEKQDQLNKKWVAEGVLIDWRASDYADNNPPAYSVDAAIEAFESDPDFLDEVVFYAVEAETFRRERIEEDAKNSEAPSDGD